MGVRKEDQSLTKQPLSWLCVTPNSAKTMTCYLDLTGCSPKLNLPFYSDPISWNSSNTFIKTETDVSWNSAVSDAVLLKRCFAEMLFRSRQIADPLKHWPARTQFRWNTNPLKADLLKRCSAETLIRWCSKMLKRCSAALFICFVEITY